MPKQNKLLFRLIIGIISAAIILATIYFGVSLYIANKLTLSSSTPVPILKEKISNNGEDVEFFASDGIRLSGWFFSASTDKAVILVHGTGENRANVYYGGEGIAKFLLEEGYNVLMYDMRGTGGSQTTRQTFGQNEGLDVIGAADWLEDRGLELQNIAIIADSLGAISTLMQIKNLDVGAIIIDSPTTEMESIITREMVETENVNKLFVPGVYKMAKLVFKIDIKSVRPIDAVSKNNKFLIFHWFPCSVSLDNHRYKNTEHVPYKMT